MDTVLTILNKTTSFFKAKGVPDPLLNAQLLLAHILECDRLALYLNFEKPINRHTLDKLRPLVVRRGKREPLQYILQQVTFDRLTLHVSPAVLIPRPETEELVNTLCSYFPTDAPLRILDLGTGTGAIGLALAHFYKSAHVTLVDAHLDALAVAESNMTLNAIQNATCIHSNWFEAVTGTFDLIVSNPPYLSQAEWLSSEAEVQQYEPTTALVAETDSIHDLLYILKHSLEFLNPDGCLALETGIAHAAQLTEVAHQLQYARIKSKKDLSGRDRFFFAWK
jgi:release factor glutamine methyltransferase